MNKNNLNNVAEIKKPEPVLIEYKDMPLPDHEGKSYIPTTEQLVERVPYAVNSDMDVMTKIPTVVFDVPFQLPTLAYDIKFAEDAKKIKVELEKVVDINGLENLTFNITIFDTNTTHTILIPNYKNLTQAVLSFQYYLGEEHIGSLVNEVIDTLSYNEKHTVWELNN